MIGVLEDVRVLDWRNFCISVGRPNLTTQIDETYAADFSDTGGPELAAEIAELRERGIV